MSFHSPPVPSFNNHLYDPLENNFAFAGIMKGIQIHHGQFIPTRSSDTRHRQRSTTTLNVPQLFSTHLSSENIVNINKPMNSRMILEERNEPVLPQNVYDF